MIGAFSLTLTLSRREREQPLAAGQNSDDPPAKHGIASPKDGERFSLSQRERAGVRERGPTTRRLLFNLNCSNGARPFRVRSLTTVGKNSRPSQYARTCCAQDGRAPFGLRLRRARFRGA
jgi:hypothetical protein